MIVFMLYFLCHIGCTVFVCVAFQFSLVWCITFIIMSTIIILNCLAQNLMTRDSTVCWPYDLHSYLKGHSKIVIVDILVTNI